jgi:hypothetical protein
MSSYLAAQAVPKNSVWVPSWFLWTALIVVALGRLAWFCQYLLLIRHNFAYGTRLLTSSLYASLNEDEREDVHERVAVEVNRLVDTGLIVGTLALAAWTALFAVASVPPGTDISSQSRTLLLLGAGALVAAPLLFRVPDFYMTLIGRRGTLFVGLTAVGLSFASIANDLLRGPAGAVITVIIAVVLVARELSDTVSEMRLQNVAVKAALSNPKKD